MSNVSNASGPSQPDIKVAYNTQGNPISRSGQETHEANNKADLSNFIVDQRKQGDISVPSGHQAATAVPSSLGYGVRDSKGDRGEAMGEPASQLDGEQMRAPGEGEIYRKQFQKQGFGEQADLASDLDRKSQEQADARDAIKSKEMEGVDVKRALGDRVRPAR